MKPALVTTLACLRTVFPTMRSCLRSVTPMALACPQNSLFPVTPVAAAAAPAATASPNQGPTTTETIDRVTGLHTPAVPVTSARLPHQPALLATAATATASANRACLLSTGCESDAERKARELVLAFLRKRDGDRLNPRERELLGDISAMAHRLVPYKDPDWAVRKLVLEFLWKTQDSRLLSREEALITDITAVVRQVVPDNDEARRERMQALLAHYQQLIAKRNGACRELRDLRDQGDDERLSLSSDVDSTEVTIGDQEERDYLDDEGEPEPIMPQLIDQAQDHGNAPPGQPLHQAHGVFA